MLDMTEKEGVEKWQYIRASRKFLLYFLLFV